MIKNILSTLVIVFLLSACKSSLKSDLLSKVDQEFKSNDKSRRTIILRDVTKFRWEKMYLFGSWTTSDSISSVIGFAYDGSDVPDDHRRMLFTISNNVVYEEDFESLDYYTSTLNFPGISDSLRHKKKSYFTPVEAVFMARKDKPEGGCKECFSYSLTPLKE